MRRDEAKAEAIDLAVQNISDTVNECGGLPDTCSEAEDLVWPNLSAAIDTVDPDGKFGIETDEIWAAVVAQLDI